MVRANRIRASASATGRSLAAYRHKRDLRKSGEPGGGSRAGKQQVPIFIIQKHDATRLHYDFRLEADGVLKSWAVPKGLPARVGDRALAIEVEDHPLDYGGFEGTIPEGNYGAGTVMLWDRGVYVVEGDYATAYRKGHIHVALAGEKLRGEWTLVSLHDLVPRHFLAVDGGDALEVDRAEIGLAEQIETQLLAPRGQVQ